MTPKHFQIKANTLFYMQTIIITFLLNKYSSFEKKKAFCQEFFFFTLSSYKQIALVKLVTLKKEVFFYLG